MDRVTLRRKQIALRTCRKRFETSVLFQVAAILLLNTSGSQAGLTVTPENTAAVEGQNATLYCTTDAASPSTTFMSWLFTPLGGTGINVCAMNVPSGTVPCVQAGYFISSQTTGAFNLVMAASSVRAGLYSCSEVFAGITSPPAHFTALSSVPVVSTNASDGVIAGTVLRYTCSVSYTGSLSSSLQWTYTANGAVIPGNHSSNISNPITNYIDVTALSPTVPSYTCAVASMHCDGCATNTTVYGVLVPCLTVKCDVPVGEQVACGPPTITPENCNMRGCCSRPNDPVMKCHFKKGSTSRVRELVVSDAAIVQFTNDIAAFNSTIQLLTATNLQLQNLLYATRANITECFAILMNNVTSLKGQQAMRTWPSLSHLTRTPPHHSLIDCPTGFTYAISAKSCYKLVTTQLTWDEGVVNCQLVHPAARLVSVPNKTALEALQHILKQWPASLTSFWSSGQVKPKGSEAYTKRKSLKELSNINWQVAELTRGKTDRLCVLVHSDLSWSAVECHHTHRTICQVDASLM